MENKKPIETTNEVTKIESSLEVSEVSLEELLKSIEGEISEVLSISNADKQFEDREKLIVKYLKIRQLRAQINKDHQAADIAIDQNFLPKIATIEAEKTKLDKFIPTQYQALLEKNMLTVEQKNDLKKIDSVLFQFTKINNPNNSIHEKLLTKIQELQNRKEQILADSNYGQAKTTKLNTMQQEISSLEIEHTCRKVDLKEKVLAQKASTKKDSQEIYNQIKEIKSNPKVIQKIKEVKSQKTKETIGQFNNLIKAVEDKHANSIKKISEVIGDDKFSATFSQLFVKNPEISLIAQSKRQSFLDGTKSKLCKAITEGKIKHPSEIIPWSMNWKPQTLKLQKKERKVYSYIDAREILSDKKSSLFIKKYGKPSLEDRRSEIDFVNDALFKLFGSKKKNGKLAPFWELFEFAKKYEKKETGNKPNTPQIIDKSIKNHSSIVKKAENDYSKKSVANLQEKR